MALRAEVRLTPANDLAPPQWKRTTGAYSGALFPALPRAGLHPDGEGCSRRLRRPLQLGRIPRVRGGDSRRSGAALAGLVTLQPNDLGSLECASRAYSASAHRTGLEGEDSERATPGIDSAQSPVDQPPSELPTLVERRIERRTSTREFAAQPSIRLI